MTFRLSAENAAMLMIDMQEKLLPVVSGGDEAVGNAARLLRAAEVFKIPVIYTEQYPKGIGGTVGPLLELLPAEAIRHEKTAFSCCDEFGFSEKLSGTGRQSVVVFGIESHICVLSTVADLTRQGIKIVVAADACGSRNPRSHNLAMDEARACGASILPAEAIIYQLIGRAGTQEFKALLPFLK
ncbi:MAG: isochorismatase family protein [Synergistaceae bacterium]|nr:isochorismatase family protein [Synergistaceae bacterium]